MDACMCMDECLPCSPETITTLLISYIPIQNKKFFLFFFAFLTFSFFFSIYFYYLEANYFTVL